MFSLPRLAMLIVPLVALGPTSRADFFGMDVAGMEAVGNIGDSGNSVRYINMTPFATVHSISWQDVTVESFDPSWLSEVVFSFSDSTGANFWEFSIVSINESGTHTSSGVVNAGSALVSGGPFQLQADGLLRLEVFDLYTDIDGAADAVISAGTFNVSVVPEPGSIALLCSIGLCGLFYRAPRQSA